jgi:hypothetical protein
MQPPGTFKLASRRRRPEPSYLDPFGLGNSRVQKIVDSLRDEILEEGSNVRIRRVFEGPRAIYRVELDVPEWSYQRTTLLDGDALDELLEIDEVRNRIAEALR